MQEALETADAPEPAKVSATDTEITPPTGTQVWAEVITPAAGSLTNPLPAEQPDTVSSQPADVWQKLSGKLVLPRHLDHRTVKGKLAWYAKNQEYLDRVAKRGKPYLFHIVEEVEKRKLPLELALLPIVKARITPLPIRRVTHQASGNLFPVPGGSTG